MLFDNRTLDTSTALLVRPCLSGSLRQSTAWMLSGEPVMTTKAKNAINLSESAKVDEQSVQPFTRSQKVYVQGSRPDIRVPMREISLDVTPTDFGGEINAPVWSTTPPARTPTPTSSSTCAKAWAMCARPGSTTVATPSACRPELHFGQERLADPS
jgi:phosphomethylpyrimidine synthase